MNFQLCGSFISVESLFKCFSPESREGNSTNPSSNFSLVIDRNIKEYPSDLLFPQSRISVVDTEFRFLNTPNFNTCLPKIFLTQSVKNELFTDVVHPEVAKFYKNLIASAIAERDIVKLHIVLNTDHVLLTVYPLFDNMHKKIIGCTLIESPFLKVSRQS